MNILKSLHELPVKPFQTPRHEASLPPETSPLKPKQGLSGPPADNLKVVTATDTLQRILKKALLPSRFPGAHGADKLS
jgi:hypothetical protein